LLYQKVAMVIKVQIGSYRVLLTYKGRGAMRCLYDELHLSDGGAIVLEIVFDSNITESIIIMIND